MVNWKEHGNPFLDFNPELTQQWIKQGFSKEQCHDWLNIGMKAEDANFCTWLRDIKQKDSEWVLNYGNNKQLRSKYEDYLISQWHARSFTEEELGKWISVGLRLKDIEYARWLKDVKKIEAEELLSFKNEELILEYENYKSEYKDDLYEDKEISQLPHSARWLFHALEESLKFTDKDYKKKEWESDNILKIRKGININESYRKLIEQQKKWLSYYTVISSEGIDKIISEKENSFNQNKERNSLNRINYIEFTDIQKCGEGGFSKVYKAKWNIYHLVKKDDKKNKINITFNGEVIKKEIVALKVLNNSQNITIDLIKEIVYNMSILSPYIAKCHGISREPETGNYIVVMQYEEGGDLRNYLKNNYVPFEVKLNYLLCTSTALEIIHEAGLIHRDLHLGNLLVCDDYCLITDLGLSRPVNENDNSKIYGCLPYIAPEVLIDKKYSQASDIYSLGIVAYEIFSNSLPYQELLHDKGLASLICQGFRPDLKKVKIPQMLKVLINKCWDVNLEKRPTTRELYYKLLEWRDIVSLKIPSKFYEQYKEIKQAEQFEKQTINSYCISSDKVIYKSKILDFKNLLEFQNNPFFSLFLSREKQAANLLELQIYSLKKEIKTFKEVLNNKSKELIDNFTSIKKQSLKDKTNEELENQVWDLEDKLEEQGLERAKIDELIKLCERITELELKQEEQLQTNIEIPTNK